MQIETRPILSWALANVATFKNNVAGPNRRFKVLEGIEYPQEILKVKNLIVDKFKLHKVAQEPMFKDFCGFITEGGYVHKHKDPNQGSLVHTRFNLLVSKPLAGGIAVINGEEVNVEEGEVWRCDAGLYEHWTTPVVGYKPRIILSFGFLL